MTPLAQPPQQPPLPTWDFVLRAAYFSVAPFALAWMSLLMPLFGVYLNITLITGVYLLARRLEPHVKARPWIGRILGRPLRFEAFYREHPPRSFLYYIFYPLFMPYWLLNVRARAEFLVFRGYTVVNTVILLGLGIYRYWFFWHPDIPFAKYAWVFVLQVAIETGLIIAIVMPITTTVVTYHQRGRPRWLTVLGILGTLSLATGWIAIVRKRRSYVTIEVETRTRLRTQLEHGRAMQAARHALDAAWRSLGDADAVVDRDGMIVGTPRDKAHEALGVFYKSPEPDMFELWTPSPRKPEVIFLFSNSKGRRPFLWLGRRRNGTLVTDMADVPQGYFRKMLNAGKK